MNSFKHFLEAQSVEDWEAALDQDPKDWHTRMVYADWLADNGNAHLADVQRWMASNKCCPGFDHSVSAKQRYYWVDMMTWWQRREWEAGGCALTPDIFSQLKQVKNPEHDFKAYDTRRAAEEDLAVALAPLPAQPR